MMAISGEELFTRLQKGERLNLPDVREEIEYHTYNIGGINIPLSKFHENIDQLKYNVVHLRHPVRLTQILSKGEDLKKSEVRTLSLRHR